MDVHLADESRVLIIYTGGTIGMLFGQQGYVPEPYFLTETLRSQSRFHDPFHSSLFSNSSSVQGFRDWTTTNSGRSSPNSVPSSATGATPPLPTLTVRSSHPIGQPVGLHPPDKKKAHHHDQLQCTEISDGVFEAEIPSLVTPRSTGGGAVSKSIRYAILEWNPLLDSSNIDIDDWIRIASEIELNYALFDAFVVLHGTDTMAYTASALSFLLEDLGKTVIMTGAQIPLSQLRNDATDNMMGALTIAGHYIIPECCLYFNHTLFRGNRTSKMSSFDLHAFESANFPPLVNVGIDVVVNWNDVIRQTSMRRFRAHKHMSPHVATLRLFPGITAATVKAFFNPPIAGVVMETFGSGNAPQRKDLMDVIREACARGVVVVAISQCAKGSVSDAYETGRTLRQIGVVPGHDMTPECALGKLSYLLSKPELSPDDVRTLMGAPLRGELSRPSVAAPPGDHTIDANLDKIQDVLGQFLKLSATPSPIPKITLSVPTVDTESQNAAAPWTWTAAEAASTQAVLLPFLLHLATARNDVDAIRFCLKSASPSGAPPSPLIDEPKYGSIAGGLVNVIDAGSGRAPLHVAAMNGFLESTQVLLETGALVHLRDTLGHTAVYYAARQEHHGVVEVLIQAGARVGGSDEIMARIALESAIRTNDRKAVHSWSLAGVAAAQIEE
ncbi:asparaginase-domain-containing protein [Cylindrobasidium torrendii FP15055 ss-10]|uniref:asparaginase n=1 Tax=Cylindrobasidium torrendii FP15055 ss-10 TaxID=1314674 RepID=A0A0D7BUH4_9AGAR|nr:asparaginase-domain-containing protein [Cylindrobasidium torrendii FP15055 ss-10]